MHQGMLKVTSQAIAQIWVFNLFYGASVNVHFYCAALYGGYEHCRRKPDFGKGHFWVISPGLAYPVIQFSLLSAHL